MNEERQKQMREYYNTVPPRGWIGLLNNGKITSEEIKMLVRKWEYEHKKKVTNERTIEDVARELNGTLV